MTRSDWVLDPRKCLTPAEVRRLRRSARRDTTKAGTAARRVSVRDRFIVELALGTGLRVMEIAQLACGDLFLDGQRPSLVVRSGKGGKKRLVRLSRATRALCQQFLLWKRASGEPAGPQDPLLLSSNTGRHLTTRAIQKAFKRCAARAGLPARYSIHCLRHTYACELYRASGYNLRLVQKQLGHARIATTQVYADVMDGDMQRALEKLYR